MLTELTIQLQKVQSIKGIELSGFSINEDLLRVFNNQRWLRKLDDLVMADWTFGRNAEPYWLSFVSQLRLNILFLHYLLPDASIVFPFPSTILNNVRSEFVYLNNRGRYTGDAITIPCLDDSILENYIDSGKTIRVDYAFTNYTLGGVKEFLKKVSKSNRTIAWWSGIMKNVTAYDMDNLFKELKAEYREYDHGHDIYIGFRVTKLGAKQDIYIQTCRNLTLD